MPPWNSAQVPQAKSKNWPSLCRPQIGVITRIGEAHLGGFGTQRELAEAKAELLRALPDNGVAVLNGDDPWLRQMADRCCRRIVWIGRGADCDLTAIDVHRAGGSLQFRVDDQQYRVPVWGRHHLTRRWRRLPSAWNSA